MNKLKFESFLGAGEGIRTLDFNLGKVAEYSKALPFLKETIPFFVEKMNQYYHKGDARETQKNDLTFDLY